MCELIFFFMTEHSNTTENFCAICQLTISTGATLDATLDNQECRHRYCYGCILRWSEDQNTCPVCKRQFRSIISQNEGSAIESVSDRNNGGSAGRERQEQLEQIEREDGRREDGRREDGRREDRRREDRRREDRRNDDFLRRLRDFRWMRQERQRMSQQREREREEQTRRMRNLLGYHPVHMHNVNDDTRRSATQDMTQERQRMSQQRERGREEQRRRYEDMRYVRNHHLYRDFQGAAGYPINNFDEDNGGSGTQDDPYIIN